MICNMCRPKRFTPLWSSQMCSFIRNNDICYDYRVQNIARLVYSSKSLQSSSIFEVISCVKGRDMCQNVRFRHVFRLQDVSTCPVTFGWNMNGLVVFMLFKNRIKCCHLCYCINLFLFVVYVLKKKDWVLQNRLHAFEFLFIVGCFVGQLPTLVRVKKICKFYCGPYLSQMILICHPTGHILFRINCVNIDTK